MLVIHAALWPGGNSTGSEAVGRIAIGHVYRSAGGDFANHLVVRLDANGQTTSTLVLRRRHAMAGSRDLLWAALDGEARRQSRKTILRSPRSSPSWIWRHRLTNH